MLAMEATFGLFHNHEDREEGVKGEGRRAKDKGDLRWADQKPWRKQIERDWILYLASKATAN